MEIEPGLRGGGSTGTTLSMGEAVEQDYMGVSSDGLPEAELELGLGLSLGGGGAKAKPSAWGERGRLLTAKDFPAVVSYGRSSFSTFSPKPTSDVAVSGTKRAASTDGDSPASARQVVGWPPIRAYRMSNLINLAKTPTAEEDKDRSDMDASDEKHGNAYGGVRENANAGFVKVNMDGVVIGRKVDLTSHSCYQSLAMMVEDMFLGPKPNGSCGEESGAKKWAKLLDGSSELVLTYEDKEGDWMLVGDVPWKMFVSSVKKLRIMRTSEASSGVGMYNLVVYNTIDDVN